MTTFLFGMNFSLSCGFNSIFLFSDSYPMVQAVTQPSEYLGPDGILVAEIQYLLELSSFIYLHHMIRSTNAAAHALANHAINSESGFEWVNCVFPTWFFNIVHGDFIQEI